MKMLEFVSKRVVDITPELKIELDEFLSVDFDRWIYAK